MMAMKAFVGGGGMGHMIHSSCSTYRPPTDGNMMMVPSSSSSSSYSLGRRMMTVKPNSEIFNSLHPFRDLPNNNSNKEEKENKMCRKGKEERKSDPLIVTPEMLDGWVKDSIDDIVRNIEGEAPFLVHIFSLKNGKGPRVEKEVAASPEIWPRINRRWGDQGMADGIILVKELRAEEEEEEEEEGGSKRTWGLVVQGRGMECAAACYILSTCRVGLCTHFCLIRAKCFGEPPEMQLTKAWLAARDAVP